MKKGGGKMEEKEKWTVPTENVEEKPKNLEEKRERKNCRLCYITPAG